MIAALALVLCTAAAPQTDAGQPGAASLEALGRHFAAMPHVRSRFVQKRRWAALKDVLESEGTVEFDRQGTLVWHTEKPSETELVLEGSTAVMKVPRLKTSQTLDLKAEPGLAAVFDSLRAVVRADFAALRKDFELQVSSTQPLAVRLSPKAEALRQVISAITLTFDARLDLTAVALEEAGGDRTDLTFSGHLAVDAGGQ